MQLGTTESERGAKQSAAECVCLDNNSPTNTNILNICKYINSTIEAEWCVGKLGHHLFRKWLVVGFTISFYMDIFWHIVIVIHEINFSKNDEIQQFSYKEIDLIMPSVMWHFPHIF